MQVRRLGKPQQESHPFSWDSLLRKKPKPWQQRLLLPTLVALLLPFLSGSFRNESLSFGCDLTDRELWNQRLQFVKNALHKAPTRETLSTFRRLWKLGLQQKTENREGIFFSLVYLESCWKKEGFSDQVHSETLPAKHFPQAKRFSQFLARSEE
jgi:hypothetical protein